MARQGGARASARAMDLPAMSFDLARPGVAPPLLISRTMRLFADLFCLSEVFVSFFFTLF